MKLGAGVDPAPTGHRVWDVGRGQPSWKRGWGRNEEALPAEGFSGGCHEFYNTGKALNPNRLLLSKVCSSPAGQAARAAPGLDCTGGHGCP